jgi:Zn-dependent protease with chaperone function
MTNTNQYGLEARYFNGKRSAGQPVYLRMEERALIVASLADSAGNGAWARRVSPRQFTVSEPSAHAPLLLKFTDGGMIECASGAQLWRGLQAIGVQPTGAVTLFSSWKLSLVTLAFLLAVITASYFWLIPNLAAVAAPFVPHSWQAKLGGVVLKQLDVEMLKPSKLPAEQQAALTARFDLLLGSTQSKVKPYKLVFRSSTAGPNAFALPGNTVVLTDELVLLVKGDLDSISGVLAHELGHHVHHHLMRNVIQSSALTLISATVIGDYSGVLATAPAVLGQSRYSRTLELEADLHAKQLLCGLKLPLAPTAEFFAKLRSKEGSGTLSNLFSYVSSHPPTDKRRDYFLSGCADLPER